MIKRIRSIFKSEFAKNVLTLMTGTIIGQLVALALAPIITRLFSTADFTTLEQYTMLMNVAIVVVTGKYEFAIMQAKSKNEARHIVVLAVRIAFWVCAALFVGLIFTSDAVGNYYQNPELGKWILTLPIALFAFALFNCMNYWFTRQKNYQVSATSKVWFSVASEPCKIATGWAAWGSAGLLLSTLAGNILSAAYVVRKFLIDEPQGFRIEDTSQLKAVAVEYKELPLYSIWGSILNRTAQWAHIGVFSHYYGLAAIGYMALCRRIFLNPLNIFSSSFGQVFFQRISDIHQPGALERFYKKNVGRFLLLGIGMVVFVHLLPDGTMGFIFGQEWYDTIYYLRLLSFWYALNFVTSSLSFIVYRLRIQKVTLVLDAIHFVFVYGAILGAVAFECSEFEALMCLVVSKVVYFSLNIVVVVYFLRRHTKTQTNAV